MAVLLKNLELLNFPCSTYKFIKKDWSLVCAICHFLEEKSFLWKIRSGKFCDFLRVCSGGISSSRLSLHSAGKFDSNLLKYLSTFVEFELNPVNVCLYKKKKKIGETKIRWMNRVAGREQPPPPTEKYMW